MDGLNINIKLDFQQIIDLIQQLSPSEKLQLNEVIWRGNAEVPLEHMILVNERKEKIKNDSNRMMDWDQVSKSL